MALTKIGTDGVKDDAITSGKIPANAVGSSELADNSVDTNAIQDQAVALSKLPHGTSSNNGKFLRANNGADPTFESIPAGVTINNQANNRVITATGTTDTLNGEANLTFDGGNLVSKGDNGITIEATTNNTAGLLTVIGKNNSGHVSAISRVHSIPENTSNASTSTSISNRDSSNNVNEHVRITSSGNVLIGASSYGGGGSSPKLYVSTTSDRAVKIHNTNSATSSLQITNAATGQGNDNGMQFAALASGVGWISNAENANLLIGTNNTERMRITSAGHVYAIGAAGGYISNTGAYHQFINTGNGQWTMQIKQEHHNGMNTQLLVNSTSNIEAFQIYSTSNSTTRFRVLNNGNCANANNSFGSLSDVKLKENIVDASSQWDDVKAVKVRNFNFKNDKDSKLLGVVAQEVETVSSGLVFETIDRDPDDSTKEIGTTKNVKYSILYMKAFKALQEAMSRIEILETKVTALEAA